MAEVIFDSQLGSAAVVRQRGAHQRDPIGSDEPEFNGRQIIRPSSTGSANHYSHYDAYEHAESTLYASSPQVVVAAPTVVDASHNLLDLLESHIEQRECVEIRDLGISRRDSLTLDSPQLDETDFECSLCFRIFLQPVTTSCGHTYCKSCLQSSLSMSFDCPICRRRLCSKLGDMDLSPSFVIANLIEKYFPAQLQERRAEEAAQTPRTAQSSSSSSSVPLSSSAPAIMDMPARHHNPPENNNRPVAQAVGGASERSERRRSSSIGWWTECLVGGCAFLYPLDL